MFAPRFFPDAYFPRRYFPAGAGGDEPVDPVVTGVVVPTAATVYAGRSVSVRAVIQGTNVTQDVTWSIESGDGSINSSGANPVRFSAPAEVGSTVLRATSVDDDDFYDEITITIVATPVDSGDRGFIRSPIRSPIRPAIVNN